MKADRSLRILSFVFIALTTPLWAGGPISRQADGTPRRWNPDEVVFYNIENGILNRNVDNATAAVWVVEEVADWTSIPGNRLQVQRGPDVGEDITSLAQIDAATARGENPIVFDETGTVFEDFGIDPNSGVLAFAGPSFSSSSPYFSSMIAVMGGSATLSSTEALIRRVFFHEMGHALGLGHSLVNGTQERIMDFSAPFITDIENMYWQASTSSDVALVDDMSGWLALYGNDVGGADSFGAIEGTIYLASGLPADGIMVRAHDLSGGEQTAYKNAASVISGTNNTGRYKIAGLPPGQYAIRVADVGGAARGTLSDPFRTNRSSGIDSRNVILGPFPGDSEYYNGTSESADPAVDNPEDVTLVSVVGGQVVSGIDIRFNRTGDQVGTAFQKVYHLSHVRSSEVADTRVTLVNPNNSQALFEVFGFSDEGIDLGPANINGALNGRGSISFTLKSAFPDNHSQINWLQVGTDGDLYVVGELNDAGVRSAYWATEGLNTSLFLPHVAKNTTVFSTFLAAVNGGPDALGASLTQKPADNSFAVPGLDGAYNKSLEDVRTFFGDDLSAVDWALLEGNSGVEGSGLAAMEFFTVLPAQTQVASLGLTSQSGTTLRFLHVATDVSQFWTGLVYMNVGDAVANVTTTFYGADGSVLEARNSTLAANTKVDPLLLFDENNRDPEGTAWVEVSADQPLVGYELFGAPASSDNDYFAGLQGNYGQGIRIDYPFFSNAEGFFNGLVAVNVGTRSGNLTFTAYAADGTSLASSTELNVAPKAKITRAASSLFASDVLSQTAWIQATTSDSEWAGFMLWGDAQAGPRQFLAGVVGRESGVRPPDTGGGVTVLLEEEDNNTITAAQVLQRTGEDWNINVVGSIDRNESNTSVDIGGDLVEDIYTFTLDSPTALVIAVAPNNPLVDLDLVVTLGDPAFNNSSFDNRRLDPNVDFGFGGTGDESVARLFQPGTYYILVSHWDDAGNLPTTTDYGLLVSSAPLRLDLFEEGDPLVGWSQGLLQNDNDGVPSWGFSTGFSSAKQGTTLVAAIVDGREASLVATPFFNVPATGLTLADVDFGYLVENLSEGSAGLNPMQDTSNNFTGVVLPGESGPTISYHGNDVPFNGWRHWASSRFQSEDGADVRARGVANLAGQRIQVALHADITSGKIVFDALRIYNMLTTLSNKTQARTGFQVAGSVTSPDMQQRLAKKRAQKQSHAFRQ